MKILKDIIKHSGGGMDIYSDEQEKIQRVLTTMVWDFYFRGVNIKSEILDVGSNGGYLLNCLNSNGFTNAQGISISKNDIKLCKERNVKATLMDMNNPSFKDNIFDIIWARHSLEHSITPLVALAHFKRMLKQDGFLCLVLPEYSHEQLNAKSHVFVLHEEQWERLFNLIGFRLISFFHQQQYGSGWNEYWYLLSPKGGPTNE